MPGYRCIYCLWQHKDRSVSLHCFPQSQPKRERWINALELTEGDLKDYHRVCSRHFPDGDTTKNPQLNLGKRSASPNLILLDTGATNATCGTLRLYVRRKVHSEQLQGCPTPSVRPYPGHSWMRNVEGASGTPMYMLTVVLGLTVCMKYCSFS